MGWVFLTVRVPVRAYVPQVNPGRATWGSVSGRCGDRQLWQFCIVSGNCRRLVVFTVIDDQRTLESCDIRLLTPSFKCRPCDMWHDGNITMKSTAVTVILYFFEFIVDVVKLCVVADVASKLKARIWCQEIPKCKKNPFVALIVDLRSYWSNLIVMTLRFL